MMSQTWVNINFMIMKIDNISSYFKTFIQVNLQHVISLNGSIESGMNSSERYAFCPVDNVHFISF